MARWWRRRNRRRRWGRRRWEEWRPHRFLIKLETVGARAINHYYLEKLKLDGENACFACCAERARSDFHAGAGTNCCPLLLLLLALVYGCVCVCVLRARYVGTKKARARARAFIMLHDVPKVVTSFITAHATSTIGIIDKLPRRPCPSAAGRRL